MFFKTEKDKKELPFSLGNVVFKFQGKCLNLFNFFRNSNSYFFHNYFKFRGQFCKSSNSYEKQSHMCSLTNFILNCIFLTEIKKKTVGRNSIKITTN